MSLGGTLDSQSLPGSVANRGNLKLQSNLFQRVDLVSAELVLVSKKMQQLGEQCVSIRQQKQNVDRYLERKSEQNRLRLMGELSLFEQQIKRKIDGTRIQTLRVDEMIVQMKQAQLYTLQMILSLQRRVHELQVQLGVNVQE